VHDGTTPERGLITFYNCEGRGGGFCGLTASGVPVGRGQASCDSSRLGWRFELAGSTYHCTDTGSQIHGNDVDLWFQTYDEGIAFIEGLDPHAQVRWLGK
jgi:3D (Asp-Asp-Asp) domain-containing protein